MTCDGLVGSLLLLHGLHPVDLERAHQSGIGESTSRATGSTSRGRSPFGTRRHRAASTPRTIRQTRAIEAAIIEAAPDVASLEFEDLADEDTTRVSLPIIQLGARR